MELKPRLMNEQGLPGWHDALALQRAIDYSGRGKPMSKLGVQIAIAGRLQVARVEARGQINAVLEIEVSDGEGKVLWEAVGDLPPEAYYPGGLPPLLTIREFLDDLKEQLNVEE